MMAPERVCCTCVYWQPPEDEGPGECRHRSPRAVQSRPDHWRSVWPKTWGEIDWCGCWRDREPEPEDAS